MKLRTIMNFIPDGILLKKKADSSLTFANDGLSKLISRFQCGSSESFSNQPLLERRVFSRYRLSEEEVAQEEGNSRQSRGRSQKGG